MAEQEKATLECKIEARLFRKEAKDLSTIVKYARTDEGEKKFKDISHAVRSFIMRGLREEKRILANPTRGRPIK